MFNLGQYLHQLLHIHQQVGLPGIGIISKVRIAAKFDEPSNTFLPPSYTYALIQHTTTDEYLIAHVAKVRHLSHEVARIEVDKMIEQLLVEITEKGEAKLDKIGYLKEAQGNFILLPLDQQFWGLQPVAEYVESTPVSIGETVVEPDITEVVQDIAVSEPTTLQEDFVEEKKKSKAWLLWGGAVLLLLAITFFYVWKNQSTNQMNATAMEEGKALDTSLQPKDAVADSIVTEAQAIDSVPKEATTTDEKEEPLVREFSKRPAFTIVLASFKTMDLAIKQAEYFRTIGINAFVLESNMPHNRKKICYGNYSKKEEATEDLEKIRKEIDPAAYIYP